MEETREEQDVQWPWSTQAMCALHSSAHTVLFIALGCNPITSCHPAQQTAQRHEDVYGISHPALLCLIPLSDSFLNGINKLSRPVSRLHFSSQRNKHSAGIYEGPQVRVGLSEASYQLTVGVGWKGGLGRAKLVLLYRQWTKWENINFNHLSLRGLTGLFGSASHFDILSV